VHDRLGEWVRLERDGFRVALSYPAVTPQGYPVERAEERVEAHHAAGDFERVHLTSPGSAELYVELTRFPDRSPQDEYDLHAPYLRERFGTERVSALAEATLGERRAWSYSFSWDEGERAVLLLEVTGDTYRIIFDPRSELNRHVLDTLSVRD
jgi:hypothetical protein